MVKSRFMVVTALLLLLLAAPAAAFSGAGLGTSASPYEVSTPAQFIEMLIAPVGYYVIVDDLDMTGWVVNDEITAPQAQAPGQVSPGFFLDGQNHIVNNLAFATTTNTNGQNVGLFKQLGQGYYRCEIKNIVFERPVFNTNLSSNKQILITFGVLTPSVHLYNYNTGDGKPSLTIENVGVIDLDVVVDHSTFANQQYKGAAVGGLFGGLAQALSAAALDEISVQNCFVTGSMLYKNNPTHMTTGNFGMGGFVGSYSEAAGKFPLTNCYSSVTIEVDCADETTKMISDPFYPKMSATGVVGSGNVYDLAKTWPTTDRTGITGQSPYNMRLKTTYADWDFQTTWVMSDSNSLLGGLPVFKGVEGYAPPPVYPIMNLTVVNEPPIYVGDNVLIHWKDDVAESDATDFVLTITHPSNNIVYTSYAKTGGYTLVPDIEGYWRVDYASSMGSTYSTFMVQSTAPDLELTISPTTATQFVTPVTVSWDDVFARSPGTNYYLQIIKDGIVYESSSKFGTYTFTPDTTGAFLVKYGCDQDEITDQITVMPPYLTGNVEINGTNVGAPNTITWSFNHQGVAPDDGHAITRYEIDVHEVTSLEPLTSRFIETIKTTDISGSVTKTYTTAKPFPASSTYYMVAPYVIDAQGHRHDDVVSDFVEVSIIDPSIDSHTPIEYYTNSSTLSIEIDKGSFPHMTTGTEQINVTIGLLDMTTEEWVFTSKTYPIQKETTSFSFDTTTIPESEYDSLVKIAYETMDGQTVTTSAVNQWIVMAPPVYPTASWKNPENGNPVTSVNKNKPVSLYLTPGVRWSGEDEFMLFEAYVYRYDPVLQVYEPYLYNGTADPVLTGSALFGADIAMATPLRFPETGTYKVCVFRLAYPDLTLQTPPVAESVPITVDENWFSPDTGATEAGKIFGLDGEAVKLVFGMLIVIGCAALPPLVFGNSHPMVILIGGVAGLIVGFALTLIPFWILLLLAIAAITMVILNVRGGSAPPGGEE